MDIRKIKLAALVFNLALALGIATAAAPSPAAASSGAGTGTHNASGTYSWNAAIGVLTLNTTSSNFVCDGPSVGTENIAGVAVTTYMMTWTKSGGGGDTFTRSPAGAVNDIVGVWTWNDSSGPEALTFNGDGTYSVAATDQCGDEGGDGGTGTGMHTASGTYTRNAAAGAMTINLTSSDFTCEGPSLGTSTFSGVTITATTLAWVKDGDSNETWTRANGTAGDIVGTWTDTDSATGNTWALTFNANGTFSVTGVIVRCGSDGGGGGQNPAAEPQHWSSGYSIQFRYEDRNRTASAVSVTGPGIAGSAALGYDANHGKWDSWTSRNWVSLGTTYPAGLPFTYTFTITDASGTRTATSTVSCFQTPFATSLSPTGSVTGTPTFSWVGVAGPNAVYALELNGSNNSVWANYEISGTSIVYNGPALTSGVTYNYNVNVQRSSVCSDGASFAQGSFIYGSGGEDVTAPTVPTGVNAVAVGSNQVNVSWNGSTDNVGVAYYQVYRNGVAKGTPAGANNTFWPDYQVTAANTYAYTVSACDAAGNCSAQSSQAIASTANTSSTTTSTTTTTGGTTTTTASTTTTTLAAGGSASLVPGWNLLGNGLSNAITVSSMFGDSNKVSTVWKWIASSNAWAFYTPTLTDGGAAYAASKGYTFLTTIDGGEGFWVNARSAFAAQFSGNAVPTTRFADGLVTNGLPAGWSLIAIGDNYTPGQFVNAIAATPPAAGSSVATSVTTLWAWDATLSGWYFYAPSLVNAATQASYISSKGYLDFTTAGKTLSPTSGFWVNHP